MIDNEWLPIPQDHRFYNKYFILKTTDAVCAVRPKALSADGNTIWCRCTDNYIGQESKALPFDREMTISEGFSNDIDLVEWIEPPLPIDSFFTLEEATTDDNQ